MWFTFISNQFLSYHVTNNNAKFATGLYSLVSRPCGRRKVPAFTACTFSGKSEICVVLELSVMAMCMGSIYLLIICSRSSYKVCLSCATGIGLTLNSVQYPNNSVVNITDIGTGSAALICTTTYYPCCFSGPLPGTHWYFPNGSRVERTGATYYRRRTDAYFDPPGRVLLHRNPGATTTGIFHCETRNARGIFQSIYVGIYTASTGEFYTLKILQIKSYRYMYSKTFEQKTHWGWVICPL